MRALLLTGPRSLEVVEDYAEERAPGPGQALVQVRAVGICGSDLHLYQTGAIGGIKVEKPCVLGHEFMAEVLSVGEGAADGSGIPLISGTRVAVEPHVACGCCHMCRAGNPNLCPSHRFMGLPGYDGAMRERMIVPSRNCFALPDSISDAAGALLEPTGVGIHAINLSKIKPGESVVIIGCGAIGLILTRLASLAGASPVIAIDPLASRAARAAEWGATHVIQTTATKAIQEVERILPLGTHVVLEAAWAGAAVEASCRIASHGGHVVLVGIPESDDCAFPHSVARRKGLTIRFSRRMKHTYPRAIALASGADGRLPLDALATHTSNLSGAKRLFDHHGAYDDGILRGIVRP